MDKVLDVNRTYEMLSDKQEVIHLASALAIARDDFGIGITRHAVDTAIKISRESSDKSARSWFLTHFFPKDLLSARKDRGHESESIARDAGVHQMQIKFENPLEIPDAEGKVKKAFENVQYENGFGIKRIFDENESNLKFTFGERLTPPNIGVWLNTLSSYHDKFGNGYKESWIKLNSDGKFSSRSGPIVDVRSVNVSDFNAQEIIENVSKRDLVASVVLLKDNLGKIIEIRFFNHHTYSNEEHSRRLLCQTLKKLEINEKAISPKIKESVEILREIKDKNYTFYDVEAHSELSPAEIKVLQIARKSFSEDVNIPAIQLQSFLMMTGAESGYVCVGPKDRGSELQVALIPKIKDLDEYLQPIEKTFSEYGVSFENLSERVVNALTKMGNGLKECKVGGFGSFVKSEFTKAAMGRGTAPTLDVYVKEFYQTLFAKFATGHNKIISGGPVQLSSVDLSKVDIPKGVFVTALSNLQDDVVGLSRYKEGTVLSLRKRTNKDMYDEGMRTIKETGVLDKDALKDFVKGRVKKEMRDYRYFMVLTSIAMTYINLVNDKDMNANDVEIKLQELCKYGNEAFKSIIG